MNVEFELFIYGVPKGQSFCGKKVEKGYFDSMYDSSQKEDMMQIEIRRSADHNLYCYYNYLIYKNVVDSDGRAGSFFGITLRWNVYCKDIMNIYRILDTVYNVYIKNLYLKENNGKIQYVVNDFNNEEKIKLVNEFVASLINMTFSNARESFVLLDSFSNLSYSQIPSVNLYDFSDEDLFKSIKKTGKIYISPYFSSVQTVKVKESCQNELNDYRKQFEDLIKVKTQEIGDLEKRLEGARSQEKNYKITVDNLRQNIETLNVKLRMCHESKDVEELIKGIQKPIEKLSGYFNVVSNVDKKHPKKESVFKRSQGLLSFANFVFILILFCFSVLNSCILYKGFARNSQEVIEKKDLIITDLKNEIKILNKQFLSQPKVEDYLWIDVDEFRGGSLKKGKEYKIKTVVRNIEYKIFGAESDKKSKNKVRACAPGLMQRLSISTQAV